MKSKENAPVLCCICSVEYFSFNFNKPSIAQWYIEPPKQEDTKRFTVVVYVYVDDRSFLKNYCI